MRPAVGAVLVRCGECGGHEYSGAPDCSRCRALVDDVVEEEWRRFRAEWAAEPEAEVAGLVVAEPDRHDWRVVDAALDRIACDECGGRLSRGPVDCGACNLAHGFRYAAVETDRPGASPLNEHAVRVNVSVVRRPHVTSAQELLVRRLLLPALLVGFLPTTAEAQRVSALVKRGATPDRVVELIDDWLGTWRPGGPSATHR
ncbi:hypothetical protein [Saccharopolyspora elongata]|uniref:Uncharacterized protein n=1 Tax=Saccharopolyspora elongata TaxID=2530387 RepID=A0A4V6PE20_9PSEU|nr:hypothetical protein [Saccharopolyspora elongata]TDD54007.1 hypothetical protein E1288_08380 [Saccharopolyspora elongata]